MTTKKQRAALLNINRLLIYSLALIGIFYDYTWAYIISLTLWVWLPTFLHYERQLFAVLQRRVGHSPLFIKR